MWSRHSRRIVPITLSANRNPRQAGLLKIIDRFGNTVNLQRDAVTGNLLRITSPNGRWISLTYDSENRITQATDNGGRTCSYLYDEGGRLIRVTNPLGGTNEYTYDANNQMLTLKNAKGVTHLTNEYDAQGRVFRQTLANGGTYQLAYTEDVNGNVVQLDVTNPRGYVRRVVMNTEGYFSGGIVTSVTRALGQPEQQTITYEIQNSTLASVTDALSRKTAYQ